MRFAFAAMVPALLFWTACTKTVDSGEHGWKPTGDAVADSTVARIDRCYGAMEAPFLVDSMTTVLEKRAETTGKPSIRARSLYNRARYVFQSTHNDSIAGEILANAMKITDSIANSYDLARMELLAARMSENPLESYPIYMKCREIFDENGDFASMAEVDNNLAMIYQRAGQEDKALALHRRATALMDRAGFHDWSFLMGYNIMTSLFRLDRKRETALACDSLLKLKSALRFTDIRPMIYMFLYDCNPQRQHLDSAFSILAGGERGAQWQLAVTEAYYTDWFLRNNRPDSALVHGARMRALVQPEYANARDGLIMRVNRDLYLLEGDTAASKMAGADYARWLDVLKSSTDASRITEAQWSAQLDKMNDEIEKNTKKEHGIQAGLWFCLIVVVIIAVVVIVKMRRRVMHGVRKRLDKAQRSRILSELRAREKEEALRTVMDHLGTKDSEKRRKLETEMRTQLSTENEWEKFSVLFAELHPSFEAKLRKHCSGITGAEQRMACMVYLGLDNKHIARLLAIHPDSVKKLRHRLRIRMGLPSETDLRAYLLSL